MVSVYQIGLGARSIDVIFTDDDFQAFRVLLRSCVSVDIQVIVGRSQDSIVPSSVAPVSPSTSNLDDVSSGDHHRDRESSRQ